MIFVCTRKGRYSLIDYSTIINALNTSTYGKNNTPYKINSRKSIMESFLYCLDNLDTYLWIDRGSKNENRGRG